MKAILVLEDGKYFIGKQFGQKGEVIGNIIFNTSMTGYQEMLTNPSYNGKILTLTYPLIGNYGFNSEDNESLNVHVKGLIVKEFCDTPSNWRNNINSSDFLRKNNIIGIKDIDTRELTRYIRDNGSMNAIISSMSDDIDYLKEKASRSINRNLVEEVSTKTVCHIPGGSRKVAVIDFGIKNSVLQIVRNDDIYIFPYNSSYKDILSIKPDAILLSNGPGDPCDIDIDTIKKLIETRKPIAGICFGALVLALALSNNISRLKFGHNGSNYPVKDIKTGRTYITSQHHDFIIDKTNDDIEITHYNVNDNTIEGFKHKTLPILGRMYCNFEDTKNIFDEPEVT